MEEALALFFQFFFEVLLQLFGSIAVDRVTPVGAGTTKAEKGCGWAIVHACLGGGLGWLSTVVFPRLLLPHPGLRMANLIAAPLLAGGLSYLFARWARKRGNNYDPTAHFWHGFAFALMFGLARFAFGAK